MPFTTNQLLRPPIPFANGRRFPKVRLVNSNNNKSNDPHRVAQTEPRANMGNLNPLITTRFWSHGTNQNDLEKMVATWPLIQKSHGSNVASHLGDMQEVSGNQIVEFRQAFAVMVKPFFFSRSFGPVESREECIQSTDQFFRRTVKIMGDDEKGATYRWIWTTWSYGCTMDFIPNWSASVRMS